MSIETRIGLLGGMFDPIHCGHLDVGDAAERALSLTDVLLMPALLPPHRAEPHASGHHRFAMAALAIASRAGWRAVDLELRQAGTSYTSTTLRRFHDEGFPAHQLFFIVGADAFLEIAAWHDYPAVLDLAHFAVVARPGTTAGELPERLPALQDRMRRPTKDADSGRRTWIFLIDAKTADVSSSAIRRARLHHQSITGLVPPAVQQHIEQHGLYENPSPTIGISRDECDRAAGRLHGQD